MRLLAELYNEGRGRDLDNLFSNVCFGCQVVYVRHHGAVLFIGGCVFFGGLLSGAAVGIPKHYVTFFAWHGIDWDIAE